MTTVKEIQSKNDDPSLSDAQKFVGGYVEVVQVNDGILIIDEEGKLKDKPVNEVASKMYADKYGDLKAEGKTDAQIYDILSEMFYNDSVENY